MVRLLANPATQALPLEIGGMTLSLTDPGHITALAPWRGAGAALSRALRAAHGVEYPGPGRISAAGAARCLWSGREQAFLVGPAPDRAALADHAALTDQGDAWAVIRLDGTGARDVLARLCPLDLRPQVFATGHTARTLLGHMKVALSRDAVDGYEIMVPRSMTGTAVEELATAMRGVSARAGAGNDRESLTRQAHPWSLPVAGAGCGVVLHRAARRFPSALVPRARRVGTVAGPCTRGV